MRQIKIWLTAISALLCSLTASAHDFSVGGIYYNITSSTDLTVEVTYRSGYYAYRGAVVIPATVTYNGKVYTVTSIGHDAFSNSSSLTSITIPEGVTYIGAYAFYKCTSLTSITIPKSVTAIGNLAFFNCQSLTSIIIPEGMRSIDRDTFRNCYGLGVVINNSNLPLSKGSTGYGYVAYYAKIVCKESELNTIDDFQFHTSSDGIHSLVNYIGEGTEVVLPNTYNGENYKIGERAFYDCSLRSVTIGSGVLSIGSRAFSTPEKVIWLTNTPPTGYTNAKGTINYVSNSQYTGLGNVKVYPYLSSMFEVDGVKYVPVSPAERTCDAIDCVYESMAAVINVNETVSFRGVSMTVKEVMPYAFYGNNHIKEVKVLHKGNIGDYAFYNCDSIQSVELSNEGHVGSQAFYDCDGIRNVVVSNNGNICSNAFYDCDGIQSIELSNEGYVGSRAFYDCDGVKSLNIYNKGYVSVEAFRSCNALEIATIANSMGEKTSTIPAPKPITFADWTSTNSGIYYNTSSRTYTITAAERATLSFYWEVSSEDNHDWLIITLDGTTIVKESGDMSGTYNEMISQGEHTLEVSYSTDDNGNSGRSDKASVSNIVVSASNMTTLDGAICGGAFHDCISLKSVKLGDKVTSLDNGVFRGCTSIEEIVIPNSVMSVGSSCFYGCTSMRNVMLGDGLTNIKEYTFANCGLEEIVIGDNITSIKDYAFKGCTRMKSAVLGNGLTWVNGTMFSGCTGLEKVEIGNNVRGLLANAFSGCSSLSTITIPRAVTTIGDKAFAGCSRLSDVIIADRTTALSLGSNGSSALFADCPLDSVYIGGKITYNTTSSKGYSPFYRNTLLRTVVITDREEQIYANEFYGCTNLQNVTIGNGVKSIGNYAFSGCSSLAGFSFGSNMESIGAEAFSDCTSLTSITSHAVVPPTCGTQALDDINKWNCSLRVPSGYAAAYQVADQWKDFFFIEDVVEVAMYTLTFMVDGEVYHTSSLVHKAEVTIPDAPTKEGYTFSGWSEVPATMPAEDVTVSGFFTINKYLVTFKIGEEVISSESMEYGSMIVVPEAPEREGYTFDGWGEVAATVPAGDVTYEGSYSVNSYLLTYVVDGETINVESIAYGTEITLLDEPVKEGYTFSGWSEVPETMPAEDVTVSGFFTVNTYKVYYYVGEELVHTAEVAYGESIPEYVYETTVEGDEFMGWIGETYETMPAHDVTYTANITNEISQSTMGDSQLAIYDLNGRKIQVNGLRELSKGIYIINGKKVVIK